MAEAEVVDFDAYRAARGLPPRVCAADRADGSPCQAPALGARGFGPQSLYCHVHRRRFAEAQGRALPSQEAAAQ